MPTVATASDVITPLTTRAAEIFVQNTGLLSHGVTNPDLGFCCYRNSQILRELTGTEHYRIETRTAFAGVLSTSRRRAPSTVRPWRAERRPTVAARP